MTEYDKLEVTLEEIKDAKALVSIAVKKIEQAHSLSPDASKFYEAALIGVYNAQMHTEAIRLDIEASINRVGGNNGNQSNVN